SFFFSRSAHPRYLHSFPTRRSSDLLVTFPTRPKSWWSPTRTCISTERFLAPAESSVTSLCTRHRPNDSRSAFPSCQHSFIAPTSASTRLWRNPPPINMPFGVAAPERFGLLWECFRPLLVKSLVWPCEEPLLLKKKRPAG